MRVSVRAGVPAFLPLALCAIALTALAPPALAEECLVCDTEIVMTPGLAACFLIEAQTALAEMQQKNLPFHLVNLGKCPGVPSEVRGNGFTEDSSRQIFVWSDIRNARPTTPREPTTTFILDRAGVLCLAEVIRSDPAGFDPAAAFRPAEMCPE
jgi:hypothetical protein